MSDITDEQVGTPGWYQWKGYLVPIISHEQWNDESYTDISEVRFYEEEVSRISPTVPYISSFRYHGCLYRCARSPHFVYYPEHDVFLILCYRPDSSPSLPRPSEVPSHSFLFLRVATTSRLLSRDRDVITVPPRFITGTDRWTTLLLSQVELIALEAAKASRSVEPSEPSLDSDSSPTELE